MNDMNPSFTRQNENIQNTPTFKKKMETAHGEVRYVNKTGIAKLNRQYKKNARLSLLDRSSLFARAHWFLGPSLCTILLGFCYRFIISSGHKPYTPRVIFGKGQSRDMYSTMCFSLTANLFEITATLF